MSLLLRALIYKVTENFDLQNFFFFQFLIAHCLPVKGRERDMKSTVRGCGNILLNNYMPEVNQLDGLKAPQLHYQ